MSNVINFKIQSVLIQFTILLLMAIFLYAIGMAFSEVVEASGLTKPSFVDSDGKEKIEEAGEEIKEWITLAFGTCTALMGLFLGFLAIRGKMEEFWERFSNIIIGVVTFLVSGTLIFSFL